MTVFKHAIKAVWKNRFAIFIYAVLFATLIFATAKENKETVYTEKQAYVVVDDRANDAVGEAVEKFFQSDRVTHAHVSDADKRLMVSVGEANFIVTIEPSAETLISTDPEKAFSVYHTEEELGIGASYDFNAFVGYLKAYAPDYERAIEMMQTESEVTLMTDETRDVGVGNLYKLVGFFLTAMLMFNIGLVNTSLYKEKFYKRTSASPITAMRYDGELFLAQSLVALFLVVVMVTTMGVAIPNVRTHAFTTGLVFFVYALSILGMVNLLTALSSKKQAVAAMTNVLSMLLATTGGAYIPSELLPAWMIRVSYAFPFYYFGENAGRYTYDHTWYRNLIIMILFGLFYFLLQSVIQKKKRTAA